MKLLLTVLLSCLPFSGPNDGRELLDKALDRQDPARLSPERQVQEEQRLWHPDPSHNRQTKFPFGY